MAADGALHMVLGTGPVGRALIEERTGSGRTVRAVNPKRLDHSKFEKAFGNIATPLEQSIPATPERFRANPT